MTAAAYRVALRAFAAGAFAALPVALLWLPGWHGAGPLGGPLPDAFVRAFVQAALPEESCKLLALIALGVHRGSWNTGVMRGFFLGLGFAAVEALLYGMHGGFEVTLLRLFTAVPCHGFLGAVMAYYLARFGAGGGMPALLKAWAVPVGLHGLYDFPLMVAVTESSADKLTRLALTGLVLVLLAAWTRVLLARGRVSTH